MTVDSEGADLVFRKICELLGPFNADGLKLTRDTDITSELEIDSVAVLDLIMDIEDAYDVSFPMNKISETRTIGDLVDAIHALKRQQEMSA